MKSIVILLVVVLFASASYGQNNTANISVPDSAKKIQVVEATCGQCQFHMEGKGCNLAVRISGKTYFVDGTSIDDHGDAHAKDGFCEAIKKAEVQGTVVNNRFKATYFKLVKPKTE